MLDLPPEILAHIARFTLADPVSDESLAPPQLQDCRLLATVSKAWHAAAMPVLYAAVRLASSDQAESFEATVRGRPDLGTHVRTLRLVGPWIGADLLDRAAALVTNVAELHLSATKPIRFAPVLSFRNLVKLVVWGVTLEVDPASLVFSPLPHLRELSLCGVKNLDSISALFAPTVLPSIECVALAYSPLASDNFLSSLPASTVVVSSSELRSALGPAATRTTLYTNRFWSILEGYTDIGTRKPVPKHLQLSDVDQPDFYSPFISLMEQTRLEPDLETIYLPSSCRSSCVTDAKRVEAWCEKRKIELRFEDEIDFMHESLIPRSFVDQCQRDACRDRAEVGRGPEDPAPQLQ
ncbi:hypothetical protein JCM11491_002447 [Sporobolomyces phaffii]